MLQHIANSNLIEGINNPDENAQSIEAWAYLIRQKKLSHDVICKVQKMITLHQTDLRPDQRGYYRDLSKVTPFIRVTRDGSIVRVCPHYSLVRPVMDNWLLDYPKLTPKESHIRFEHIHPFVDGNGRTGRMLMWWIERQMGQEPTLIRFEDRQDYYKWFEEKQK